MALYQKSSPNTQISANHSFHTVTMLPQEARSVMAKNRDFRDFGVLRDFGFHLFATLTDIENAIYMRQ